jgi:putative transcriptional regulator
MARTKKTTRRVMKTSGFGQAVLASLRGWERGEPVTIRQVADIPQPRARRADQVKRLRATTLGVSQAVFARLIGVSPKLVEAWESGRNVPSGPVCRLFELIERDPRAFVRRYAKGAA